MKITNYLLSGKSVWKNYARGLKYVLEPGAQFFWNGLFQTSENRGLKIPVSRDTYVRTRNTLQWHYSGHNKIFHASMVGNLVPRFASDT